MIVSLLDAQNPAEFGGKSAQLAHALRARLPVPPGVALSFSFVARVVAGDDAARADLLRAFAALSAPVAGRRAFVRGR
ncbi:MAG: hypothetical protein ABI548_14935 [Polyangiaceae bacterium]